MIGFLFIFSIVVLSQAPTLIRFADASSLAICFWRLLISGIFLFPLAARGGRLRVLKELDREDWAHLLSSGVCLFLHFYFFFRAVQETSVANSTVLFSLNPVTTAIGAYFVFRERISQHLLIACLFGFLGVSVLFGGSMSGAGASQFWGDFWALLSAVFFSGYILSGKHVRQKLSNFVYAAAIYFQTALYAAIAMLILQIPFTGYSTQTWWAFLALAVLPTLLGHAIFTYCLIFLNVNFMSCRTLVEPILAAIVAYYLFKEPLTELAAVAFLLTCASVIALYWPWFRATILKRA